MKATVEIPNDLYVQARELAAARGQQVAALITEGLQKLVITPLPRQQAKSGGHGKTHMPVLSPSADRWLREWRAMARRNLSKHVPTLSAAEVISRMRR